MLLSFCLLATLTSTPAAATWSPDQADLLFASNRDGNGDIFILPAGGSEWVPLTRDPAGDNWPVWSHDRKRIIFQSRRTGNLDIFSMADDGSDLRQLTDHPESDYLPACSPDGKSIAFTSWRQEEGDSERAPHLYVMNVDGSQTRRLVATSLGTSQGAVWSPDGKSIVYGRKIGENGADLFLAASDGSAERRLTHDGEQEIYNGTPTFSPDGQWIAFYSAVEKSSALVILRIDGSERRTVLAEGQNWYPRWSPDGSWLVYCAATPADEQNIEVLAIELRAGATPVLLAGGPSREAEGSWR